MSSPPTSVWLVAGYALILIVVAWGFDLMARHVSHRATRWRTGEFVYHPTHDAWVCPQDQWLWPTSFDPARRVMNYQASPSVCNNCPVKSTCTTSNHGRSVSREIDPWPHSEAGRFHRGIACFVAALAVVLPLGMVLNNHSVADMLVLGGVIVIVLALGLPLARHLWHSPANAPEHLLQGPAAEDQVLAAVDRYSTRWGWALKKEDTSP